VQQLQLEQDRLRREQEKLRQEQERRQQQLQQQQLLQEARTVSKPLPTIPEQSYTPPAEWQHLIGWCGNISRQQAEQKLKGCLKGTFLLRWSDHAKSYVLSYSKPGPIFVHVARIVPGSNGSVTVETEENVNVPYKNLLEFITHTMNKGIISMPINV